MKTKLSLLLSFFALSILAQPNTTKPGLVNIYPMTSSSIAVTGSWNFVSPLSATGTNVTIAADAITSYTNKWLTNSLISSGELKVSDSLDRDVLYINNDSAYKWFFNVGPINYGYPLAGLDEAIADSPTTNAVLKDIRFWLEPNYFVDFNELNTGIYARFYGGGHYNTNWDALIFASAAAHAYYSFGSFKVIARDGNFNYTLFTYDGIFTPTHISSQRHPMALYNSDASANLPGFATSGALEATTLPANGSTGTATVSGNDPAFIVTLTPGGTGIAAGNVATIRFIQDYSRAPVVMICAGNTNAGARSFFVVTNTTTNCSFGVTAALTSGEVYKLNVHVIE